MLQIYTIYCESKGFVCLKPDGSYNWLICNLIKNRVYILFELNLKKLNSVQIECSFLLVITDVYYFK